MCIRDRYWPPFPNFLYTIWKACQFNMANLKFMSKCKTLRMPLFLILFCFWVFTCMLRFLISWHSCSPCQLLLWSQNVFNCGFKVNILSQFYLALQYVLTWLLKNKILFIPSIQSIYQNWSNKTCLDNFRKWHGEVNSL